MGRYDVTSLNDLFEGMRADYRMARPSRHVRTRDGLAPGGSHADYHYRNSHKFYQMIEMSRAMQRDDCVVGQAVDRAVTNIVQDGITLDPNTGDKELDTELKSRWTEWCGDPQACDAAGERSFWDIETTCMRAVFGDGDIFALPNRDTRGLQLIEGHLVRNPSTGNRRTRADQGPTIIHGVELDGLRRRQGFHIATEDRGVMGTAAGVQKTRRYPVYNADGQRIAFHVYRPRRATQTRGVTALAPIFEMLAMFEDVNFAKLVQAQVVSCFAILEEPQPGFKMTPSTTAPVTTGETSTEILADGRSQRVQGIQPGMRVRTTDAKLTGFSPNVPNPEFFPHVELILKIVGVNLGLPLGVMLLEPRGTFSSYRGAIDQARIGFRTNQQALWTQLHLPTYLWKLREWTQTDAAIRNAATRSAINPARHRWNPPGWRYLEPLKDASAELVRVGNALTSRRRLHAEHGVEWEELANEVVEDNKFAIVAAKAAAREINKQFPDGEQVHWREVMSLPTPNGLTVDISTKANEETDRGANGPSNRRD